MKKIFKDIIFFIALIAFAIFVLNPVYVKPSTETAEIVAESYMKKQSSVEQFEILVAEIWQDGKHIQFVYNVKPTEDGMEKWSTPDGQPTEDGWITGKKAFVKFYKIGNLYFTGLSLKLKIPGKKTV